MAQADHDEEDPLPSDIAFHVAILKASGNRFYAQLSGVTESALRISIRMQNRYKGVRRASVPDHRTISDAILAGDAARAETATRELIQEALDLINKADSEARSEERPKTRGSR
jgi:DNA-binding FadR family transcriptional regulator